MTLNVLLFGAALVTLFWAADQVVRGVTSTARYLKWSEFVIAFFIMAIVGSFPNLFIGFSSVGHGIPELAFGDIVGNSVVDLTLVLALAVAFGGSVVAAGKTLQASAVFTILIAVLPLLLILDGQLSRGDGVALLTIFLLYSVWLVRRQARFTALFNHGEAQGPVVRFRAFLAGLARLVAGTVVLVLAAEGVVRASIFFASSFGVPVVLIGILVVGLSSALPELYFAVAAARRNKSAIILGELMGSIIVLATLVLGSIAVLEPIKAADTEPFAIARFFLVFSTLFFLLFVRTDRRITKKEAVFLGGIYAAFVASELAAALLR